MHSNIQNELKLKKWWLMAAGLGGGGSIISGFLAQRLQEEA